MNNNQNNRYNRNGQQRGLQRPQPSRQSIPYPPVKHRSRAQARAAIAATAAVIVVIVLLLLSFIILLARCADGAFGGAETTAADTDVVTDVNGEQTDANGTAVIDTPEDTGPVKTIAFSDCETEMLPEDVHKGYQILVNYENGFDFESGFVLDNVFNNKKRHFYPFDTTTKLEHRTLLAFIELTDAFMEDSGKSDIVISSAWRDEEMQANAFAYYEDLYGEEYAVRFATKPGHSEHHSGLAMDLTVYGDGNSFATLNEYPDWFEANAHKYGFILRYPEDKVEITKIEYEYWHYRFVGVPHAYYIKQNNLCLEEYIELLKSHDYFNPLTFTDDEGTSWKVYYTRANTIQNTRVIVPKDGNYEISGNNVDGFIVTVNTSVLQ